DRLHRRVLESAAVTGHGRMDDHRHAGGLDLVDQIVGLRGAVQDELEAEFPLEPERGQDVLRALGSDERRNLPTQDLGEDLQLQVAARAVSIPRLLLSAHVVLRLEELGAHHGNRLRRRPRAVVEVTGDLRADRHGDHRDRLDDRLVHRVPAGLGDHRLAAHDRAGPVARVDRGHAVLAQPLDQPLAGVVGVDRAQLRLDRVRPLELVLVVLLVQVAGEADDAVRVDEPGRDDLSGEDPIPVGNAYLRGPADALDLAVPPDQDDAVLDGGAGHGVDRLAAHGDLRLERGRREGDQGGRGRARCNLAENRSEEHTSELQSRENLVCRLLLEKKKETTDRARPDATAATGVHAGTVMALRRENYVGRDYMSASPSITVEGANVVSRQLIISGHG